MKLIATSLLLAVATTLTTSVVASSSFHGSASLPHAVQLQRRAKKSKYPAALATPPESSLPAEWVTALNDAIAAGKIPDIPPSVESASGDVAYPAVVGKNNKTVCSWTLDKCDAESDVLAPPDGEWTIAFDDGPTAASPALYKFLKKNKQRGTHFMVSS